MEDFYHIFLKAAVYDWDVQYFIIYDGPFLLHLVFCRFYCRQMKDIEKAFAYISWKKKNICIHFPQFWISNLNVSFHEPWPNILEEVEEKDKNHISFHVFCINVFCIHVLCILFLLTWLKYEIRSSCFFYEKNREIKRKRNDEIVLEVKWERKEQEQDVWVAESWVLDRIRGRQ